MAEKMKPVFIIGAARSGSRIYLSLFNEHTEIDMIEEPHILNPWWLHPDFARRTRKKLKHIHSDQHLDRLMDLMYSNHYYGYFWESIRLDRRSLREGIGRSDRSLRAVFEALMEESRIASGKKIPGAKYPVHLSYVPVLLQWFPACKIVHIVRDPRAFFASQLFKYARQQTRRHRIKRMVLYIPMLVHAILQFVWSVRVYENHKHLPNYYLSRYEDVVQNPYESIQKLCTFLEIEFHPGMLAIPVIDSSFGKAKQGISGRSLEKWRTTISPVTAFFIQRVAHHHMKAIGYA